MHLSDAFISPTVAGVFAVLSAVPLVMALRKVRQDPTTDIPLMGVMGAFVFAIQMINFSLPGTGSSGHLTGGILLAALLGPLRGYLVMTSILIIQCLLFADGGLMALGCNLFNMGVCTCLIAYPLFFAPWKQELLRLQGKKRWARCTLLSLFTCAAGAVIGAFFVTLETEWSGITEWPFSTFLMFMVSIHLLIGLVEGFATAALLCFLLRFKPELLQRGGYQGRCLFGGCTSKSAPTPSEDDEEEEALAEESNEGGKAGNIPGKGIPREQRERTDSEDEGMNEEGKSRQTIRFRPTVVILGLALLFSLIAQFIASELPDGLEWSVERMESISGAGTEAMEEIHTGMMARVQRITALMPDYEGALAGLTGSLCVLTTVCLSGYGLRKEPAP